jgi:hypothetical protein
LTEAQLLSAETRNLRSKKSLVAPAIKKAGFIPVFLMFWTDALEGETPRLCGKDKQKVHFPQKNALFVF